MFQSGPLPINSSSASPYVTSPPYQPRLPTHAEVPFNIVLARCTGFLFGRRGMLKKLEFEEPIACRLAECCGVSGASPRWYTSLH
ncbi:hypothetical protein ASPTUDRAFT_388583 [Aspergillus tubingensis CBS 134.48]|uniref:Uncharacterized protein n=1 Tax=Aspergillus tubingensis (strain CBS 134.48) TaxID=767770 RepID=A0A1L9NHK2_ASPTC|nr:hypothetical protein ASPTUDRAFT_388583 [Aspergillus tubingensis CBS 134.48]